LPIHGTFSFVSPTISETEPKVVTGGRVFSVTSGLSHARRTFPVITNSGENKYAYPVGRFVFHAFDRLFDISALVDSIDKILSHFDEVIKPSVEDAIRKGATREGLDPEKVLNEYQGGWRTMFGRELLFC
jgi:hypothetical protein